MTRIDTKLRVPPADERRGMPCFDLFIGLLLWGMRNVRDIDVPELQPLDERDPIPVEAIP